MKWKVKKFAKVKDRDIVHGALAIDVNFVVHHAQKEKRNVAHDKNHASWAARFCYFFVRRYLPLAPTEV